MPSLACNRMMSSGQSFLDALFEAISGVTTTGLSMKATLVGAPATFLFARAWMQWYGVLGIVVLSLEFAMQPGPMSKRLAATETETDDLVGGTRAHARRVLQVYGVLTALGIMGCLLVGARFFALIAREEDAVAANDLKLPADAKFSHADEETTFRIGDEVVILTHSRKVPELQERWKPDPADSASKKNK